MSVNASKRNNLLVKILLWLFLLPIMAIVYVVKSKKLNKNQKLALILTIIVVSIFILNTNNINNESNSQTITNNGNNKSNSEESNNQLKVHTDKQEENLTNIKNEDLVTSINELILTCSPVYKLTIEEKDKIYMLKEMFDKLTDSDKKLIEKKEYIEAAYKRINYLVSEDEKLAKIKEDEKKEIENKAQIEKQKQDEIEKANNGLSELEYKELCVDYSYEEITKDETTYLDTYIKKDFMVRQIGVYEPTGETVYFCGENSGNGSYVSGTFYLFDRRSNAEKDIELYDKIYVYGKVFDLHVVSTWTQSSIDPYVEAVYIEFNGKFGE